MLKIGSLVDNKYKILNEVGRGGMSVVYLAINERANKMWAVKEVRKDGVCDFEAVKQGLVVETDMLKKLSHPHLPSIIDVIDTEDSFLIVMDYIEGQSLQKVLKMNGAQPVDLVVEWGKQLCDVLGYLHSREPAIIYRDMKPSNVMLKHNGDVTLIDFGTAREFKNRAMVEDTTCLGTRGYAAPEQFGGRGQTDARTDIYCLGATLYHLVTGHSPAEPPYEIKPLHYWDASMRGSGLEHIIRKCCNQDPNARYQSCAELMYDLEHVNDIDARTRKARRQKWNTFIASLAIFATGLVGMAGSAFAKAAATTQTYDFHLSEANRMFSPDEFGEFVGQIRSAVSVDPGRYEAYDMLLDNIEYDGKMDVQSELGPIRQILMGTPVGSKRHNQEFLLEEDQEGFADIQFRVGKLLFLMTDGQDSNLRDSKAYFHSALSEGELMKLDPKKAKIASSLETIADYIPRLGTKQNLFQEDNYSFADMWTDFKELVNENAVDSMGSRAYGIALYNQIAARICEYYQDFYGAGVPAEEMLELCGKMSQEIQNILETRSSEEEGPGFQSLIENAQNNLATAERSVHAMSEKGGA